MRDHAALRSADDNDHALCRRTNETYKWGVSDPGKLSSFRLDGGMADRVAHAPLVADGDADARTDKTRAA